MGKIDVDQRQRVYHDLLQQAKEHKVAAASPLLGIAHFHGWYLEKQETLGFRFLTEAAQLKMMLMRLVLLQRCILKSIWFVMIRKKHLSYIKQRINSNHYSLTKLVWPLCYLHGVGVERNIKQAQQLLS